MFIIWHTASLEISRAMSCENLLVVNAVTGPGTTC